MKRILGFPWQFLLAVATACVAHSAQAVPVRYEMNNVTNPIPTGWFIYDRDTDQLIDYALTFFPNPWPSVTFTAPPTFFAANNQPDPINPFLVESFRFSDQTTAFGLGENFDVFLGYVGNQLSPVKVDFFASPLDGISVGQLLAPIFYSGQFGGGQMQFQARFHIDTTFQPDTTPAPVPVAPTWVLMLSGLGIPGLAGVRRSRV